MTNLQSIQYCRLDGTSGQSLHIRLQTNKVTFPAESSPSISIRTSWSLLQRTREVNEVNKDDKESPMMRVECIEKKQRRKRVQRLVTVRDGCEVVGKGTRRVKRIVCADCGTSVLLSEFQHRLPGTILGPTRTFRHLRHESGITIPSTWWHPRFTFVLLCTSLFS